ncbi:hypothetical protein ACF09H_41725 [Streptomyces sp. NPDC014983]|uniref:hypothetical protein n=1 Tax=Streptomyces sp. NPDC014983 TaxID=3364933 RepID=UPI0036FE15D8
MQEQERNTEDITCLVLLRQIATAAEATMKLEPPEAATALRTLAGAYTLLVNPPLGQRGIPSGDQAQYDDFDAATVGP